jgi:outer membrane scaffolding protein for murein synthesis (MipA/OmpV family)
MKRRLVLLSVVNAISDLKLGLARRLLCALTAITGACLRNSPAFAQLSSGESVSMDVAAAPRYEGASAYRVLPLPDLSLSNSMFFVQGLDGGAAVPLGPAVAAGLLIAVQPGRKEGDATVLSGTGNIATSPPYGAFARWHPEAASDGIRFLQSAHAGYGHRVTLSASYPVVQKPSNTAAVPEDTVCSNGPSEQTYCGIDSAQAATSGLPVYSPSRGFSRVDVKVSWDHRLNDKWSVRSAVGVGGQVGDTANSPIVQRRADVSRSVGAASPLLISARLLPVHS